MNNSLNNNEGSGRSVLRAIEREKNDTTANSLQELLGKLVSWLANLNRNDDELAYAVQPRRGMRRPEQHSPNLLTSRRIIEKQLMRLNQTRTR